MGVERSVATSPSDALTPTAAERSIEPPRPMFCEAVAKTPFASPPTLNPERTPLRLKVPLTWFHVKEAAKPPYLFPRELRGGRSIYLIRKGRKVGDKNINTARVFLLVGLPVFPFAERGVARKGNGKKGAPYLPLFLRNRQQQVAIYTPWQDCSW